MILEEVRKVYVKYGGEIKKFTKFADKIDIGYRIEFEKRIEDIDVHFFAFASGDFNPIHFDEELASSTKFRGRVVHGMLTTSLVSAAVARIPGIVVLLEVCFQYLKPVRIGDTVKVVGEVVEKDSKNRFKLNIKCIVNDTVVVEGFVRILLW